MRGVAIKDEEERKLGWQSKWQRIKERAERGELKNDEKKIGKTGKS